MCAACSQNYKRLLERSSGGNIHGGAELQRLAEAIFGVKAAYCQRTIKDAVDAGREEPSRPGQPPSLPQQYTTSIFLFVSKLRKLKVQVYKSTCIDYLMRLISGTPTSLKFAKVIDGEYVPCPHGGVEWVSLALIPSDDDLSRTDLLMSHIGFCQVESLVLSTTRW